MNHVSEKESVYTELERTQHKCAKLKREIKNLRKAVNAQENTILRREASEYRAALSNIVYRIDRGDAAEQADLRKVAATALMLRGLKTYQRREIKALHAEDNG